MAAILTPTTTTTTVPTLTPTVTEVQEAEVSKLWPAILYTSLMMAMSSVGNVIVCYVYGFRWHTTVTKIFIFCLAALDLTNSLICMPTEIVILVKIITFDTPSWCKVTRFLTYTLNGSSSLILAAIALDRWYKVCRPVHCFFTHRRAKLFCFGAMLLAASISWPSLVFYGNLTLPIEGTNATGVTCLVSDDFIDTWWPLMFYSVYFACYMCLVVAITVLYSMIAVKLVQLKKKQRERLAAKYAGLRSSKLMFPSQDCITANNDDSNHHHHGDGRTKEVSHHHHRPVHQTDGVLAEHADQTHPSGVSKLRHLEEEIERRRSVTFRLPRKSTSSEEKVPPGTAAGKNTHNGIRLQTPDIVINQEEEEEQKEEEGEEGEGEEDGGRSSEFLDDREGIDPGKNDGPNVSGIFAHRREAASGSSEDIPLTERLLQSPDRLCGGGGGGGDLTRSSDSLRAPGGPDHVRLLSRLDTQSYPSSPEDTGEFEQGIHFTADDDLAWQHNPIIHPDTAHGPALVINDVTLDSSRDVSFDVIGGEMGSSRSLLSGRPKERAAKTWSDSFALLSVPRREAENGKPRIHKTSSDSNLVIPEKHQTLTSARRSFLMPQGGYPGGHTPTSRLPTPTDCPTPNSPEGKPPPPLLSSRLLVERLNKKMAYRPAKTTRMLFAISIVFVISFLPFFCIVLIRAVEGRAFFASLTDTGILAINIFIRSSFISNAANPIIYGLCNKQFRTECGFLFKQCSSAKRRDVNLRVIEATDDVLGSNS